MTSNRRLAIGIAAVVAIAAIAALVFAQRTPAVVGDDAAPSAPSVALVTARDGALDEQIAVQGRVGPPAGSSAKIAFAQGGIVQSIDVRVGDRVSAGDVVSELDRASLGAALQAARADAVAAGADAETSASARLAVAQAKLATLQRGGPAAMSAQIEAASTARQAALKVEADAASLDRAQQLLAAGVVASKDVDAARAQLASDRADQRTADAKVAAAMSDFRAALQQARADVAGARNDVQVATGAAAAARARRSAAEIAYANGRLTAPAGGVVLAILKHPGEAVDSTQPVVEIGPPVVASVTLALAAGVARRVRVGDPVTLSTSQSASRVSARVAAVVPAVDPATQLATIVVRGAPPDAVAGDAVNATITVGHASGVIVPASAIVQDPQTGNAVVFVRDPHPKDPSAAFRMQRVVVRASNASQASIASGVRSGDRVAAEGGYALLAPMGG